MRLFTDRDLFERRVLFPACLAGSCLLMLLIHWRVM